MTGSNAPLQLSASAPWWSPPVLPATYPDRHPHLTDAEKTLMEQYATAPVEFMTGGRARNVLHQLARFETPFMDIVRLTSHMDTTVVAARRHLFTYMVQTGLAFWAWPKEIWVEVIQAGPGRTHTSGTRFWMLLLAYLFCDVLYVGAFTAYGAMAEVIFGQSMVATEVDKVRTPLVEAGYAADQKAGGRLHWLTTLCMLVNRNPSIEAFSAQLLKRDLIGYAPFLLSALVKRSQTTLHTASIQLEVATCATTVATAATTAMTATVATTAMVAATPKATSPPNGIRSHKVDHHKEDHYA